MIRTSHPREPRRRRSRFGYRSKVARRAVGEFVELAAGPSLRTTGRFEVPSARPCDTTVRTARRRTTLVRVGADDHTVRDDAREESVGRFLGRFERRTAD